ncbi:MAG TPA: nuclear transport factor 2 family protein [Rhizomicrobium sp.]|nr:nuclear transport factor 2 family protein [Rhizomicrobium sp.]
MSTSAMSRRKMFEAGGAVVAGTALLAQAPGALASEESASETAVRKFFKAWEQKDWGPFDAILADDFTFTSPNGDDHISKAAYKANCWESQKAFVEKFDIELLMAKGGDVVVKYLCHTTNGKSFRNLEYHRVRDGRIESIECYFGSKSAFASAVGSQ